MRVFSRLRRSVALMLCPELQAPKGLTCDVEVQCKLGGPWVKARLIDGLLHWAPGPLGLAEAEHLQAVRAGYVRANREVPAAIDAALAEAIPRSAGAETLPASQAPRDADRSECGARRGFPILRLAPTGASR